MEEVKIKTPIIGVVDNTEGVVVPKKRGKGRPPKSDLEAVRNRNKGKLGRPKNDTGRMQEFKERLLATGGTRILDTMIRIALDDNHPGQMAAIKLAVDRILPMSAFDAAKNGGSTPQVTINISGINEPKIIGSSDDEVIDV
jgi:hypothetical protein